MPIAPSLTFSFRHVLRSALRLCQNGDGAVAVEFAFIAPILILLYLGTYVLGDAIDVRRKVLSTSEVVGDLVTRSTFMNQTGIDNIFDISQAMMIPSSADSLTMVVSTVAVDAKGKATVQWSRARHGSPRTAGSVYRMPTSFAALTSTYFIVTEVKYAYQPAFAVIPALGKIDMTAASHYRPRRSLTIPWESG